MIFSSKKSPVKRYLLKVLMVFKEISWKYRRLYQFRFWIPDIVKENENDVDMASVFQRLSEDSIPGLPPGGGLFAK